MADSNTQHLSLLERFKRVLSGEKTDFDQDETYYRQHYASSSTGTTSSTGSYDRSRSAYQLGHLAGASEAYAGRSFDEAESDLRSTWESGAGEGREEWSAARERARSAYTRGQDRRIVLSEEQLNVGKREVQAGEVRVHKTVETRHVQEQVPLVHEEVTIERRPISADGATVTDIGEETIRVPLMAEEAVVEKRVVPVEEVVLHKRAVTEEQTVEDTVRKERLATEGLTDRTERDRTDR